MACTHSIHLSIISPCSYELSIGAVGQTVHVVVVTLLLEDIALRLPLPDQQLAKTGTAKCQPLSSHIHCYTCDTLLGNTASRRAKYKVQKISNWWQKLRNLCQQHVKCELHVHVLRRFVIKREKTVYMCTLVCVWG